MPDLVNGVASRPSARWKYLAFGTSATLANATWANKGTASGKGIVPILCGEAKVGKASPPLEHLDLPWRIGQVGIRRLPAGRVLDA
jgi:hypothetical protein